MPPDGPPDDRVDFEALEQYLRVLASGTRLELLSRLRIPKTLEEIRLTPSPARAAGNPDRVISRQAVQNHLVALLDVGLVRHRLRTGQGRRPILEYYVDHARLFAVVEELRRVRSFENTVRLDPFRTDGLADAAEVPAEEPGARLLLVHGVQDGRVYPLHDDARRPLGGWLLGRSAVAAVRLDYDPYVSAEHAEIVPRDGGVALLPLPGARNGTTLNWRALPAGVAAPLAHGDVIGLGRSRLLYRDA